MQIAPGAGRLQPWVAPNLLRRAMGKKKPEEMAKQRSIFVNGLGRARRSAGGRPAYIFDLMGEVRGLRLQQVALRGLRAAVVPHGRT